MDSSRGSLNGSLGSLAILTHKSNGILIWFPLLTAPPVSQPFKPVSMTLLDSSVMTLEEADGADNEGRGPGTTATIFHHYNYTRGEWLKRGTSKCISFSHLYQNNADNRLV